MALRILIVDGNDENLAALRDEMAGDRTLAVESRIVPPGEAEASLRRLAGPVVAIVGLDEDAEAGFRLVESVKAEMPHVHWLLASADESPQTILRALRAGADEFLGLPAEAHELEQCLERVRRKAAVHEGNGAAAGHVVTVFSPQGGVGCTTIATNLAVCVARRRHSVAIVDLVLQFGSVTSFLDLTPSFTIVDFAEKLERFDPMLLEGSLVEHPSGVRVLAEPLQAEDASRIGAGDVRQTLQTLARSFDIVVVDMPKEVDDVRHPALEAADLILFPIELSVPSMKRAQRALHLFERFGVSLDKVAIVVNRHLNDRVIGVDTVEKTLGKPAFWMLPNDYVTAAAAINQGSPVVELNRGGLLAKGYEGLARRVLQEIGVEDASAAHGSRFGVLGRWVQRGRASLNGLS